jgi:hypothetical protein
LGALLSRACSDGRQLDVDFARDRGRRIILERQNVARVALEPLRPQMLVRERVDQLRGNPLLIQSPKREVYIVADTGAEATRVP